MSREVFYAIVVGILLLCVPAMLPSQFFKSDDRTFIIATIAVCVVTLLALVGLIPFLYKFR